MLNKLQRIVGIATPVAICQDMISGSVFKHHRRNDRWGRSAGEPPWRYALMHSRHPGDPARHVQAIPAAPRGKANFCNWRKPTKQLYPGHLTFPLRRPPISLLQLRVLKPEYKWKERVPERCRPEGRPEPRRILQIQTRPLMPTMEFPFTHAFFVDM